MSSNQISAKNSCCKPGVYVNYNLNKANPFDGRIMPFQRNLWCSNDLLLRDPALRCQAKIQPLDVSLNTGTKHSHDYNLRSKLWH